MFNGKIYVCKNINGKCHKIEREFHDPHAFDAFMNEAEGMFFYDPRQRAFGCFDSGSCATNCKEGSCSDCICDHDVAEIESHLPSGSKISDYQKELDKIEAAEKQVTDKIEKMKAGLAEMKDLRAKFVEKGKDEIVSKIDTDIKALEKEIKEVEKMK